MSSLEQLDLAAKARANQRLISYLRIVVPALSAFCVMLASASEAPVRETQLVAALAAVGVIASVLLWTTWRYKLYSVALFCFLFAVGDVLSNNHPHHHTILEWIAGRSYGFLFIFYAVGMGAIAWRYSTVNRNEWATPRKRLDDWFQDLNRQGNLNVIEFTTGSFWTGYWNYRILHTGDSWLVAKFKKGTTKIATCSVVELKNVAFMPLQSGKWNVEITEKNKTRKLANIEISPPLPAAYQPFIHRVLA